MDNSLHFWPAMLLGRVALRGRRTEVHGLRCTVEMGTLRLRKWMAPAFLSLLIPAGSRGWSPRRSLLKGTTSIILVCSPCTGNTEPRAWAVPTQLCHFLSLSDRGPVTYSGCAPGPSYKGGYCVGFY